LCLKPVKSFFCFCYCIADKCIIIFTLNHQWESEFFNNRRYLADLEYYSVVRDKKIVFMSELVKVYFVPGFKCFSSRQICFYTNQTELIFNSDKIIEFGIKIRDKYINMFSFMYLRYSFKHS